MARMIRVKIKGKGAGHFYRAGLKFTETPRLLEIVDEVDNPEQQITPEQYEAIKAEPKLAFTEHGKAAKQPPAGDNGGKELPEEAKAVLGMEMPELEAKAKELGLTYPSNIKLDTLKGKVIAAIVAKVKEAE